MARSCVRNSSGRAQAQPDAAHAEERVLLRRQRQVGHLLVAADVERAQDERQPVQRLAPSSRRPRTARPRSARVSRSRNRNSVRIRPTPSAAGLDRLRRLRGSADVGDHLDAVAVGGIAGW